MTQIRKKEIIPIKKERAIMEMDLILCTGKKFFLVSSATRASMLHTLKNKQRVIHSFDDLSHIDRTLQPGVDGCLCAILDEKDSVNERETIPVGVSGQLLPKVLLGKRGRVIDAAIYEMRRRLI